jgi:hypothetical protein
MDHVIRHPRAETADSVGVPHCPTKKRQNSRDLASPERFEIVIEIDDASGSSALGKPSAKGSDIGVRAGPDKVGFEIIRNSNGAAYNVPYAREKSFGRVNAMPFYVALRFLVYVFGYVLFAAAVAYGKSAHDMSRTGEFQGYLAEPSKPIV